MSPFCRNKADATEFPFYTLPTGYTHFPVNVAKYATATVQIDGTTVTDLSNYGISPSSPNTLLIFSFQFSMEQIISRRLQTEIIAVNLL